MLPVQINSVGSLSWSLTWKLPGTLAIAALCFVAVHVLQCYYFSKMKTCTLSGKHTRLKECRLHHRAAQLNAFVWSEFVLKSAVLMQRTKICSENVPIKLWKLYFWMFCEMSRLLKNIFFLGFMNVKRTFHFNILQTLWNRYFWTFSEHSETSGITFKRLQNVHLKHFIKRNHEPYKWMFVHNFERTLSEHSAC